MSDRIERILDALRQKMLEAAVQGRLVPQNPDDEPASVLLERIAKERERLIHERKVKRPKNTSHIFRRDGHFYETVNGGEPACIDDQIPFEIPDSWGWCRLSHISSNLQYGTSKRSKPSGKYAVLRMGNIQNGEIDFSELVYSSDEEDFSKLELKTGDVLFNRTNSLELVGKTAIFRGSSIASIFAGYLIRINQFKEIDGEFLSYFLNSPCAREQGKKVVSLAVNQANISGRKLSDYLIPVPPYAEQQRIANALKARSERLDAIGQSRIRYKRILSETPTSLRQQLIQAAIQGRLVPQDPHDEPASILLERIDKERERLIQKKEIKKPKSTSRIYRRAGHFYESVNGGKATCIDDQLPFDIPGSWAWVRGKSLFESTQNKAPDTDFSYIDIDAIDNKHHVIKGVKLTKAKEAPSRARRLLQSGDILFSLVRPYLENVAMVETQHASAIASTGFYIVRTKAYVPKFAYALFLSPYVIQGLNAFMRGDNSPSIRGENIEDYLYPLPPLAEQGRICDRLDKLLNTMRS